MSESKNHMELVEIAVTYIQTIVPSHLISLIQYDSPSTSKPPKVLGNFIPDVYFWDNELLVIGEAKTDDDFERKHSREQFGAYLDECSNFHGKSLLVISVPWSLIPTAKNYFRKLKKQKQTEVPIIILNEFGRRYEV